MTPERAKAEEIAHQAPQVYRADLAEDIEAALLAERRRVVEECAKVAEQDSMLDWIGGSTGNAKGTAMTIVAAIRARVKGGSDARSV